MKKLCASLLIVALMLSIGCPAFAADDKAIGTTLRLTATEGTVTLKNQNDRAVSIREDMKLYSGYTIKTSASSYAYVSLDDSKAIKLDASTTAEIRKSGKKLEVLVSTGKLFFNVTAPLEDDETLEIRTSTIVTGVRGTSGVVNYLDERTSSLYLFDGKVTMRAVDPETGAATEIPVQAGQTATVTRTVLDAKQPEQTPEKPVVPTVTVSALKASEVPGFAAIEIAKDTALQQKISEQSGLDVETISKGAAESLEQEQKQAEALTKQAAQAAASVQGKVTPAPVTPAPPSGSAGSSSSSPTPTPDPDPAPDPGDQTPTPDPDPDTGNQTPAPDPGPAPDPDPSPDPEPTPDPDPSPGDENVLTEPVTAADVAAALQTFDEVRLQLRGPADLSGLAIPAGKTVSIEPAQTRAAAGLALASSGGITVSGKLLLAAGTVSQSEGTITVAAGGELAVRGSLENKGTVHNLGTLSVSGSFTNAGSGVYQYSDSPALPYLHNTGTFQVAQSGVFTQQNGRTESTGSLTLAEGARLINLAQLDISGALTLASGAELLNGEAGRDALVRFSDGSSKAEIHVQQDARIVNFGASYILFNHLQSRFDCTGTFDTASGMLIAKGQTIPPGDWHLTGSYIEVLGAASGENFGFWLPSLTGVSDPLGHTGYLDAVLSGATCRLRLVGVDAVWPFGQQLAEGTNVSIALEDDTTLTVPSDITQTIIQNKGSLTIDGSGTLALGSHSLTNLGTLTVQGVAIRSSSNTTTINNGSPSLSESQAQSILCALDGGSIHNSGSGAAVQNYAVLHISDGLVTASGGRETIVSSRVITMSSGMIENTGSGNALIVSGSATISGGTVKAAALAISGAFSLAGDVSILSKDSAVCSTPPSGYHASAAPDPNGYYTLEVAP